MQPSDKARFKDLLTDALAFYRRDVSKFALSVWWQACQPFELEQIAKALTAHAMDPERGQFAPMPADIVRELRGTHTDRSLVAWGKVYEAIGRVGQYQSVVFDDGAIHAAVEDMGGWIALCRAPADELPFLQRRFCETYRAHSRRPDLAFPPVLAGQHQLENSLANRRVAPPMLVGNQDRARAVMAQGSTAAGLPIHPLDALPAAVRPQLGAA